MKNLLFLFISVFTIWTSTAQTEVGGVELPQTLNYGETLHFNGAGVREKFWLDMYVGALYLQRKSTDAKSILNNNSSMAIRLHIVSGLITSDKMIDAVNEGFENSTNGNTDAFKSEINKFKSFFKEEIKKNDIFDIVYTPSEGVVVYKNKRKLGVIEGDAFKKAMFGIWLSNKPADDDLKEAMLGK